MAVDYSTMTDDQIIAAYKARFGGDVSAIAGYTDSGIDAAALYDNMVKWYDGFLAKNGRSPSEQEWIGAAQAYGDISPQAAKNLYDKGANYVKTTGQRATPEEWGQWLAKETRVPTFDRDKYSDDIRRWDLDFDERKRQADLADARAKQQLYANLLSNLSDVQDWVKYQIAQSGMPEGSLGEGGLADVFARTPAFGAVTPDPTNSWEYKFKKYWDDQKQKPPTETVPVNTPPQGGPVPQEGPPQVIGQPGQGAPQPPDNSGEWEYTQFPDASMGNPQPGMSYAQVMTPGWRNKRTGETRRASSAGQPGIQADFTPGNQSGQPLPWQSAAGQDSDSGQPGRTGPTGQMVQPGAYANLWTQTRQAAQQEANTPRTAADLATQLGQRQPTSIGAVDLNRMTPSQKQMQSGAWSAQGLNVDDMWDKVRKAQPQGQAQRQIRWG